MKKTLSFLLLSLMIIVFVLLAMPYKASATWSWMVLGSDKPVVKQEKKYDREDLMCSYDWATGILYFSRPSGYPYISDNHDNQPTQSVQLHISYYGGGWSTTFNDVPTPNDYNNPIDVKTAMDAGKFPSGKYEFHAYDTEVHHDVDDDDGYVTIVYTYTRSRYGEFTYISPYDQLDTPTHLRWEGNTAVWQPVEHADYYSVQLQDETDQTLFSQDVTKTSLDFSGTSHAHYSFTVTAYSNGDYIHSMTAQGPVLRSHTLWYMPNGGTGSQIPVGASGKYVLSDSTMSIGAPPACEFVGWSLTADGSQMVTYVNMDRDYQVYAIWDQYAGSVDTNVYWSLFDGVLRIYGEGPIQNRTEGYPNPSPFRNRTDITKVIIGNGITQIGDWFFDGCTSIKTIDLSNANSLTRIGGYAFNNCSSLSNIIYPSNLGASISQLGPGAFRNCENITSFQLADIPNSEDTQYIGAFAFSGCTSLKSVTIPKTVDAIAYNAFEGCTSFETVFYGGSEEEWDALDKGGSTELANVSLYPYASWGAPVGENAMYVTDAFGQTGRIIGTGTTWDFLKGQSPVYQNPIQDIVVEEGIVSIGQSLFYDCDFIQTITLPSTLKTIGYSTFEECDGIINIIIPNSVETIDQFAFHDCKGLINLFLGSGMQSIGYSAFSNCDELAKVYYDGTREQFYENVAVETNNDSLDDAIFIPLSGSCGANLTYNYQPETGTLTISGTGAMDDYTSDKTSITPWDPYADDIKAVVITDGVTTVGENAFWVCEKIETVTFGNTLQSIGKYAFCGCESITGLDFPNSLTSIGAQAFADCKLVKSIILPNRLTSIPASCFTGCTILETIFIPKTVTSIGAYAFYNCNTLTTIYFGGTEEQWNAITIGDGNDSSNPIDLYCNCVTMTGWQYIAGKWYYYNADGDMQTGWQYLGNKWYYLNADGTMAIGWVKDGGTWYYMSGSGAMVTGWQKVNNIWYYFQSSGAMQIGWAKINGVWYYFQSSGAMVTGWQKVNNVWYYFQSSGAMQTGWAKINGVWYYFQSSGAMVTGWQKINNVWYYFQSSGAMQTGWAKINGVWYYFESSGAMLANTSKTINGKQYYFNSSGACTNP